MRTDTYDESTGLLTRTDTPGILSIAYRYDAYGNLTEQRDLASDRSERYGYDALQRLTTSTRNGAGSSGSTSYTYDKLGNFITKGDFSTSNGYAYAAGKSQVQSVSMLGANSPSVMYAYDGNGNVVTRTASDPALSLAIGYDIDNHALTIRRPASGNGQATDNGSTFRYGPDGQRYFQEMRQPGQSARQLIYLGKDYEKEYTGAGQVERWYLPGGAVRIRSTDPAVASGTYFIHGDRLGSTSVMTDRNGQVIGDEQRSFDAFGRPRAWTDWNVTEGANATPARNTTLFGPRNRRGFTQHEHVDRTNIIHMNGRIFDAELGRFYGVDPFVQFPSNSQSLNPYSYVLNNPMAGTDPTGYIGSACPAGTATSECLFNLASGSGYTYSISTSNVAANNGGGERQTVSSVSGQTGEASRSNGSMQPMAIGATAGAVTLPMMPAVPVSGPYIRPPMSPDAIERLLDGMKNLSRMAITPSTWLTGLMLLITPRNAWEGDDRCHPADCRCGRCPLSGPLSNPVITEFPIAEPLDGVMLRTRGEDGRFVADPNSPPSPYAFTDAQRRAAWRRIANDPSSRLSDAEREEVRLRGWRGPQRVNEYGEVETMELSHEPTPLRDGGTEVVPKWPDEHAATDPFRKLKKR